MGRPTDLRSCMAQLLQTEMRTTQMPCHPKENVVGVVSCVVSCLAPHLLENCHCHQPRCPKPNRTCYPLSPSLPPSWCRRTARGKQNFGECG